MAWNSWGTEASRNWDMLHRGVSNGLMPAHRTHHPTAGVKDNSMRIMGRETSTH
tara:strand:- start:199 stop:360 length:162 start_codon:yes stop_codon:yes gene_type:complete